MYACEAVKDPLQILKTPPPLSLWLFQSSSFFCFVFIVYYPEIVEESITRPCVSMFITELSQVGLLRNLQDEHPGILFNDQ